MLKLIISEECQVDEVTGYKCIIPFKTGGLYIKMQTDQSEWRLEKSSVNHVKLINYLNKHDHNLLDT